MYWAVASVMFGEAAVFHSVRLAEWAAGFFVAASLFVLLVEEPSLKKKFGEEYEAYCRDVPGWIPRLRAKP